MIKIILPLDQVVSTCHDLHPVLATLQQQGIPRQEHAIINSPDQLLEPFLVMHIHHGRHIPLSAAGVYRFASLLCAMEGGK